MLTRRECLKLFGYTTAAAATGVLGFPNISDAKLSKERLQVRAYGHSMDGIDAVAGKKADHTYVQFYYDNEWNKFRCWGGSSGGRWIKSVRGRYLVANCYRGKEDGAKIGVYGLHGGCHQSTNCFLFTANGRQQINRSVRGYVATKAAYGAYGLGFHSYRYVLKKNKWGIPTGTKGVDDGWYGTVWKRCWKNNKKRYSELEDEQGFIRYVHATDTDGDIDDNLDGADEESVATHRAHQSAFAKADADGFVDLSEMIASEMSASINIHMPDVDTKLIKSEHIAYHREHMGHVNSGIKQDALAKKVNDLSDQFQKSLASRLTPAQYEELMGGVKHGSTVDIIDSSLIGIAGVNPEELK